MAWDTPSRARNAAISRLISAAAIALFLVFAANELTALPHMQPAGPATAVLGCTNPASGASWDIKIVLQDRTADSFPAI